MTRCMRPVRRLRKASCRAAASPCCAPPSSSSASRPQNDDQKTGVEIVRKALSAPARQIAINAGEDGSVIVGKILEKDQYTYGFDSQTGEYGNLVSKGIIDPTKVVRAAIQNAASVAALLITTEAMVAELPKKNAGAAAAACPRAAAWAAWTSDPDASGDYQEMQNPGSDAGVFVCVSPLVTPRRAAWREPEISRWSAGFRVRRSAPPRMTKDGLQWSTIKAPREPPAPYSTCASTASRRMPLLR